MNNCTCCTNGGNLVPHKWSDGWGMVTETCSVCNGTSVINPEEIHKLRQQSEELAQLKTNIALFLHSNGLVNDPRVDEEATCARDSRTQFELASFPTLDPIYRLNQMIKAASEAPLRDISDVPLERVHR